MKSYCVVVSYQLFVGTYCFHHQNRTACTAMENTCQQLCWFSKCLWQSFITSNCCTLWRWEQEKFPKRPNYKHTANSGAPTSTKSGTMVEDLHGELSESTHGFDSKQTYSSIYFLSVRHWDRVRNRIVRLTHPTFSPKRHNVQISCSLRCMTK